MTSRTRAWRAALDLAVVLILGMAGTACAPLLFSNGTTRTDILIDANAPAEVRKAASEIVTYGLKTTGGQMQIKTGEQPTKPESSIRLQVTDAAIGTSDIKHADGYTIRTSGRDITITGGSPRGVLYGAYDFIERALNVRWFMPSAMGEDIDERTSIAFPELNVTWNPAFQTVSGLIWAGGPGSADWELRSRAKVGPSDSFGHNWSNILEAERLARSDSREVVRQRLAFIRLGFDYTEAITEMLESHYRNDPRAVLEWTTKAVERINKTANNAPQAFFVSLAVDQTRYLSTLLLSTTPPWVQLRP